MNLTREKYQLNKEPKNKLILTFADKVQIQLEDAEQIDSDCMILFPDSKFTLIVEARNLNSSMTGGALNFLAKNAESRHQIIACAVLLNNLPIRLMARLYIRFHRPPYPTKIFENSSELNAWVEKLNYHNHNPNQIQT